MEIVTWKMEEVGIVVKVGGELMRHDDLVKRGIVERRSCAGHYDLALDALGRWWKWSHTHDMWMECKSL